MRHLSPDVYAAARAILDVVRENAERVVAEASPVRPTSTAPEATLSSIVAADPGLVKKLLASLSPDADDPERFTMGAIDNLADNLETLSLLMDDEPSRGPLLTMLYHYLARVRAIHAVEELLVSRRHRTEASAGLNTPAVPS